MYLFSFLLAAWIIRRGNFFQHFTTTLHHFPFLMALHFSLMQSRCSGLWIKYFRLIWYQAGTRIGLEFGNVSLMTGQKTFLKKSLGKWKKNQFKIFWGQFATPEKVFVLLFRNKFSSFHLKQNKERQFMKVNKC